MGRKGGMRMDGKRRTRKLGADGCREMEMLDEARKEDCALWLMGRVSALPELASPASDRGALESDVRTALKRRAARSAASAEARLSRKKDSR